MIDSIKKFFYYLFLPLTLIGGYIFYLLNRKQSLESEVGRLKANKALADVVRKAEEAKVSADISEEELRRRADTMLKLIPPKK